MVVLQTLGSAEIRIGERVLLPSTARAFAATLYLAESHGREVKRADLQALLFPERDGASAAHSVRQLLYRLRQMGVPVEARGDVVVLPSDQVELEHETMGSSEHLAALVAAATRRGVLPGYAPNISQAFARWVEDRRAAIQAALLQYLVAQLAVLRSSGRMHAVEPVANAVRALDPLNEEAALALAEVLALRGQKAQAVQLLNGYLAEMAPYGADLRVQAKVLRGRISEHTSERRYRRLAQGPFVGREDEMAELWQRYQRSKLGEGCAVVLHGEPGVGKTRLASEFLMAARLDGATCLRVECAAHDVERPLSAFIGLVPKLLAAPGGLGVAPSALTHLRRLTQAPTAGAGYNTDVHPQRIFEQILEAIRDLIAAVSEEAPVAILVDDAHSLDNPSFEAIVDFAGRHGEQRVIFLLTSRRKLLPESRVTHVDRLTWQRIAPLVPSESEALLHALEQERNTGDGAAPATADASAIVEMAAGNPLYLRWLVTEGTSQGGQPSSPSLEGLLLQRIQGLSSLELRAFVAAVTLGRHCQLDRLVQVAGLSAQELLTAVQELEQRGYLSTSGTDIRSSHPLLSDIAMKELPPLTLRLVHETAAGLLEAAATPQHDVTMLWDAAECWHLAGSTARAVELLRSCADHCLGIGQPATACRLLARAIELPGPMHDSSLFTALVEAADLAEDYPLVLDTVHQLRRQDLQPISTPIHDDLEFVELRAIRFSGTAIPQLLPRLEQCFRATDAPLGHRLRAASSMMAAYELLLDPQSAQHAFQELSQFTPETRDDHLNHTRALIQYHTFAGSQRDGIRACDQALSLLPRDSRTPDTATLLANIGTALFRCGASARATTTLRRAHKLAHGVGMHAAATYSASVLAWCYFVLGDIDAWQRYDHLADSSFKGTSDIHQQASFYLSNKIEFALFGGHAATADHWLTRAEREYAEIDTPGSTQLRHAFHLRIEQLGYHRGTPRPELDLITAEHQLGCSCGMHDKFTEAYWFELDHYRGRAAADRMLEQYLTSQRRDQYPLSPGLARVVETRSGDTLHKT